METLTSYLVIATGVTLGEAEALEKARRMMRRAGEGGGDGDR